jgi:hypothetical protein
MSDWLQEVANGLGAAKKFLNSDEFKSFLAWAKALDKDRVEAALKQWCDGLYDDNLRKYFAANSWLIMGGHFTTSQLKGLCELLSQEKYDELEKQVADIVDLWRDRIQKKCHACLDESRNTVLDRAFDCHANGDWLVSVPLFLMQADGICLDRFSGDKLSGSVDIYDAKNPKQILSRMSGKLYFPFLSILKHQTKNALVKSASAGNKDIPLNRNLVLHGRDSDYANRENSLRAMAAVDFALWLCEIADEADAQWEADRAAKKEANE